VLRSLWRQRGMLLRSQGRRVQHMQKALTQMNIQLANVISDVVGETGQKILRAIVAGERDGQALAKLKNAASAPATTRSPRACRATGAAEHLFALKQALDRSTSCGTQLAECDAQIEAAVAMLQAHEGEPTKIGKKRGRARNAPKFDLRSQLFKMCGVDLTRIDGIDVTTALAVVSEIGTDMSRFPTRQALRQSWLGLCPGTKITGGKVMSGKTKRVPIAQPRPCAWPPPRCAPASRRWARTSGECAHAWTSPKPSPPPPTSWRA
jgi:transposase